MNASDALIQQINALELELQGLEVNYQQDSRRVRTLETQLEAARELLERNNARGIQTTEGINNAREQVKLALVDEEAALVAIEASLEQAKTHRLAIREELAGLEFVHGRELERVIREGEYHDGKGAVVQLLTTKPR